MLRSTATGSRAHDALASDGAKNGHFISAVVQWHDVCGVWCSSQVWLCQGQYILYDTMIIWCWAKCCACLLLAECCLTNKNIISCLFYILNTGLRCWNVHGKFNSSLTSSCLRFSLLVFIARNMTTLRYHCYHYIDRLLTLYSFCCHEMHIYLNTCPTINHY